jgi:hypothetical protein
MDNQQFQRENLQESMAVLRITMQIRTFKPLHKLTHSQPHQIIAENWMAEMENSLAKGGLFG